MKKQAHFSVCLALKAQELVDVSYFHHRLWTVHRSPKTLKRSPDFRPPSLLKHPAHTAEPVSFPARQQHLFVLRAVTTAQQSEHTPDDAAFLRSGGGELRGLERNSITSLCELHKRGQWEWKHKSKTDETNQMLGWSRPAAGNVLSGYLLLKETES